MFRRISYIVAALAAISLSLVSCLSENGWKTEHTVVPEGYVSVSFRTDIPAMQEVVTRAVDPDGAGVQNMTLFCFDSYGLFISTATASLAPASRISGTFTAEIPENTSIIHFVANQNMSNFAEDDFRGKSESEVMALLEGSSGRMIYWSRFESSGEGYIVSQLKNSDPVRLIRNHAMFSVSVASGVGFNVTGFAVCNTNAFGTVAPYHPDYGFPTDGSGSGFAWPGDEDFVTLPVNAAKLSDVVDVTDAENQYVFETENRADDPVSVIIKGSGSGSELYYRVLLITEDGSQIMVRRNHHYIVNIVGELANGQPSFEAALEGPATNNVWISISEDVNEVQNGEWILAVDRTSYVLDADKFGDDPSYTVGYTLTKRRGSISDSDMAEVTVTDSDGLVLNDRHDFDAGQDGVGRGRITFDFNPLGNGEQMHEYDILVRKGKLQRTVKVILVRTQQFVPAWVSTQVYGAVDGKDSRANVTAMFTIPETCPAELFPMNVYISTENLDARSELTVVIEGSEDWYGEDTGTGYKYVYPVSGPGSYSVYFENILNQEQDASGTMTFEAECFETMRKTYTFARHERTITIDGHNSSVDNSDELIKVTVPQKRGAAVQFDMVMMDLGGSRPSFDPEPVNVEKNDEFLLYSQNLDYYEDGEESLADVTEFDCRFYDIPESDWGTGGRMMMFMPRHPTDPVKGKGRYSIYMKTNKARSAETVRIASNHSGSPSFLPGNYGAAYVGNSYRSVILEIDNYDPFRFGATVAGQNAGNEVSLTYVPYQPVDIEFDVTAFTASDGTRVDPFGEEFEIYIDAPMLEIDGSRLEQFGLDSDKLREDPTTPGRFIYTVEADREAERAYGSNERKTLPFRTAASVSSGDIVISSDQEKVVFYTETFSVANAPISGTIRYRAADDLQYVPVNGFVSFERTRNNSRIGSMTIVDGNGAYELRLRKEYEFNWYSDEVELRYEDDGGNVYTATYPNLNTLYESPDIVLEQQAASGN